MTSYALKDLLPANIFAVLLVMCRVGAAITWLPGFGASYVPSRVKIVLALFIALFVTPVLADSLQPSPKNLAGLVSLMVIELVVGSFIGLYANLLVLALEAAGGIIAMQSSLASAIVFNPGEQKQETLPASLFGTLVIVMIFAVNLHHMLLEAVVQSYEAFPAGSVLPMGDLAQAMVRIVSIGFQISIQIAAPYIIVGTVFYVALGLIGRVMPQLQIFYVGLPLQILGGLSMLLITIPTSMLWFLGTFQNLIMGLADLR